MSTKELERQIRELRADLRGMTWKCERLTAELSECKATVKRQRVTISKYRKRLGLSDPGGIKRVVFSLIAEGLSNAEIVAKGYKKETVARYRQLYCAALKHQLWQPPVDGDSH